MATSKKPIMVQGQMFRRKTTRMPNNYYSGDKPNPNLRAFVEAHLRERPYNPETDLYIVPAFDKPIKTTKATAIYNMHTYWSKYGVPHCQDTKIGQFKVNLPPFESGALTGAARSW